MTVTARTVFGWPAMPVILVSGYAASAGEARASGVPILMKPLELGRLVDAIRMEIDTASRRCDT